MTRDDTTRVLLAGPAKHHILECLPVLDAHESVEQRVEGAGEIVQDSCQITFVSLASASLSGCHLTREIEEILIDLPEEESRLEVDIAEPLEVERGPGDKEEEDHAD